MIRVALVDDQHLVRAGVRTLLERDEDIVVVGEASDGASGFALAVAERPDVVLMDLRMPGVNGLEGTRLIMADQRLRAVQIIVLTTFDADEQVFEAIRNGAAGFLRKDTSPEDLRRAVRIVASGDALLSPALTRRVMQVAATARPRQADDRLAGLTDRERDILAEVGAGRSNEEIAARFVISLATARTHVSRLLSKFSARDRAQLVLLAYETGLVVPGE